ncbi:MULTISPECIES: DUF899 family protein [unclassified Novosphingobium]|uniref:DUF899 family protein n=1 Tax=unclassified Novosphingobium TaxID=2644732 RepID=UPI0025FB0930|nr:MULTISPECIES: DUF899 family protein [unclassified Novosphingobium]HQV04687.1 DUF899 family protein [Novosphingobium sp.]
MDELPEANTEIFEAEQELIELQAKLAQLRQAKVRGTPVEDYSLTGWDGQPTRLSDHFGDKKQMILIHNMGMGCSYCTLWANGFTGLLPYLERVAAFVMVSPDDIATQQAGAQARGWKFKMLSAKGTSLFRDMGFELNDNSPWPGMTTLYKDDGGQLRRHSLASFGPGDMFCPAFSFVEQLPFGGDLGLD